ncbi:helix-turn-helix domain-containing protein [Weissella cibaria]|uniref:Helix-turn-helix transcriptional regulator n=1 Tax=Weissella cibaria TaxID=137591 RepID=A0A9Q8JIF3_9LACO|nr:helix-turn-helix transcriptional regulator [Weissella cibaria]TVV27516.1 helix-turn-helix transcriptional regulator [Weissella cibaria]TVV40708.1 helix-turn-helix transcriptional regulator [Weissella cibaria]
MKKRNLDLLAVDLKKYRLSHRYSYQELANITGLAKDTLYSLEMNRRSVISVETIEALADILHMDSGEFFIKYVALVDVPDEEGTKKDQ